jgi:hypothetical protein
MDIDHKDMVAKLAKPGADIAAQLSAESAHALHMAVGVSGEVAELLTAVVNDDRDNCLEELGDIEFYFEGLCQGANALIVHEVIDPSTLTADPLTDVLIQAGNMLDIAKKIAVYNDRSKWPELTVEMQRFRNAIDKFYAAAEFTHAEALAANINKLGKRYQDFNYSDAAAKARADKADGE